MPDIIGTEALRQRLRTLLGEQAIPVYQDNHQDLDEAKGLAVYCKLLSGTVILVVAILTLAK